MAGVINDLQVLTTPAKKTIVSIGVGQEHALARWVRIKKAKNGARLLELPVKEQTLDTEFDEEAQKEEEKGQGNDEDGFLVFSR